MSEENDAKVLNFINNYPGLSKASTIQVYKCYRENKSGETHEVTIEVED